MTNDGARRNDETTKDEESAWGENMPARQDLGLRPIAVAIALYECIKFITAMAGFVIPFSGYASRRVGSASL
jgi:hypothetical protein